jgi:hypothetical protein
LDLLLYCCGFVGIVHFLALESHVPPAFSHLAFVLGAALAPILIRKRPVIATARSFFKELLFILILL